MGLFGAYSLIAGLALAELALRLVDYRFSPIFFVRPDNADDHRPFHMGGWDVRIRGNALTIPDPDLLWRPDPRVSRELTPEGFRGEPVRQRAEGTRLIVALGDSNTLGPLSTAAHWPGILEDLLRANRSDSAFQVINAGVHGYSSFQGLRRYRQIRQYSPDVVYFGFGANDAQPVNGTDEDYSRRLDASRPWSLFRLGPPFLHLTRRVAIALRSPRPPTHRVPPRNYRQNLELFVADARRAEILPILVTRPFVGASDDPSSLLYYLPLYNRLVRDVAAENGVPLLDAFALLANDRERFVDPIHNDRIGYRRLAEAALSQLKALGFVQTDTGRDLASVLDLATADDRRLELGPGFWSPEGWPDSAGGRWTKAEATVELKRRQADQALLVDLSCFRPGGHTSGFLEVNGRERADLPGGNGRHRLWVRLSQAAEERVSVRFVVQSAYRPRDLDGRSDDSRVLGVFLHEVRLERRPPEERWQRDGTLHPEQAR